MTRLGKWLVLSRSAGPAFTAAMRAARRLPDSSNVILTPHMGANMTVDDFGPVRGPCPASGPPLLLLFVRRRLGRRSVRLGLRQRHRLLVRRLLVRWLLVRSRL